MRKDSNLRRLRHHSQTCSGAKTTSCLFLPELLYCGLCLQWVGNGFTGMPPPPAAVPLVQKGVVPKRRWACPFSSLVPSVYLGDDRSFPWCPVGLEANCLLSSAPLVWPATATLRTNCSNWPLLYSRFRANNVYSLLRKFLQAPDYTLTGHTCTLLRNLGGLDQRVPTGRLCRSARRCAMFWTLAVRKD